MELFKNKEARALRKEYKATLVLNYISNHPDFYGDDYFEPAYFMEDIKVGNFKVAIHKLIKQGFLVHTEENKLLLTEKGNEFLKERMDYVKLFHLACPYVSLEEFCKRKSRAGEDEVFERIMLPLLLKKIKVAQEQGDYIGVKNLHQDIAVLYENIDCREAALYHFITRLYYDVSGLEYYDLFLKYIDKKVSRKEMLNTLDFICITPAVLAGIERVKEVYGEDLIDVVYRENPVSINLCTRQQFKELVEEIVEGNFDNMKWQQNFWNLYKAMIAAIDEGKIK